MYGESKEGDLIASAGYRKADGIKWSLQSLQTSQIIQIRDEALFTLYSPKNTAE